MGTLDPIFTLTILPGVIPQVIPDNILSMVSSIVILYRISGTLLLKLKDILK